MLVRGIYYEGWKPAETPVKMHSEEFYQRIRHDFPYSIQGDIEQLVHTVLETLQRHISEGEWHDLRGRMPADLVTVIPA
ncbi:DUF2267 domain-containing protein [Streptomyces antimycoticus]